MKELPSKEEWYAQQSKEQLVIFLKNDDYIIKNLRNKTEFLTGCPNFGDSDGTDGACVECSCNNLQLWERCNLFCLAIREYRKKMWEREIKQ